MLFSEIMLTQISTQLLHIQISNKYNLNNGFYGTGVLHYGDSGCSGVKFFMSFRATGRKGFFMGGFQLKYGIDSD